MAASWAAAPSLGTVHAIDGSGLRNKAAEVIGLYLDPPLHAAVFCVDEKTAIQALDRRDPRLPRSPDRAERHGFEYVRHGTLSLYVALDTRVGRQMVRHGLIADAMAT